MHMRQFQHFLAVVDHGSIGLAAEAVNISAPALSKSIRRLEDELGVRLFDRDTRGMTANTFGQALIAHARIMVSEMRNTRTELDELRGLSKGLVRVGTQPSASGWLLPRAIGRLRKLTPGIRATVVEGTVDLVQLVLSGDLDMIVVALSTMPPDPSLSQQMLYESSAAIIGGRQGLLGQDTRPGLSELALQEWVLPARADPLRQQFETMFAKAGIAAPEPSVETASPAMIRAMVTGADCLSFMPVDLFQDDIASGQILRITDPAMVWRRQIGVVRRQRSALSPAARGLINCLRDEVSSIKDGHAHGA